ncbi:MAG: DAK2 domain-containing protein [Faecalibacterium sp.]|nr:DAK2 domain-containing protein [Ruminococcus sp.]MCM1391164.1 DAK2 domain-containing protein [Ruminococcus sp.]MCM1486122.1 DAK2 domain-containing protein [Faecalibacterium sp.]
MTYSEQLINALYSGYNKLLIHRTELDMMNVFPVADSDTGSNMVRTMKAGVEAIKNDKDKRVGEILEKFSKTLLRNARGNSGVILSILFKGFSDNVKKEGMTTALLSSAFDSALKMAGSVLSNPVYEGTILSIVLTAKQTCDNLTDENFDQAWQRIAEDSMVALEQTRYSLDVLKNANVQDSGAKGLCLIISAVNEVLNGKTLSAEDAVNQATFRKAAQTVANNPKAVDYTYCTEFIINRTNSFPASSLESDLKKIGDSIAVVPDDSIIKVHLHTNVPNHAIGFALRYGALTDIKIDNMELEANKQVQ